MTDKPKRPRDANELAKLIVDEATEQSLKIYEKPRIEAKRPGGIAGGRARAEKLSAAERSKIGKAGATARWKKDRVDG